MEYFIIYLILINLSAFSAMYIDKKKARYKLWRIRESTLFILAALGGSIGAVAGMHIFRHKTKKMRFFVGFRVILMLHALIAFFIIFTEHFKKI